MISPPTPAWSEELFLMCVNVCLVVVSVCLPNRNMNTLTFVYIQFSDIVFHFHFSSHHGKSFASQRVRTVCCRLQPRCVCGRIRSAEGGRDALQSQKQRWSLCQWLEEGKSVGTNIYIWPGEFVSPQVAQSDPWILSFGENKQNYLWKFSSYFFFNRSVVKIISRETSKYKCLYY